MRKVDKNSQGWQVCDSLQWGRTFSSAESPTTASPDSSMLMSFNGAALFQVRKAFNDVHLPLPIFCFNGAALFQVRKALEELKAKLKNAACFNGAALFQVRKEPTSNSQQPTSNLASMGPHFFKCGKNKMMTNNISDWIAASMGPHFFKCGKIRSGSSCEPRPQRLQWGRTFSSAERREREQWTN